MKFAETLLIVMVAVFIAAPAWEAERRSESAGQSGSVKNNRAISSNGLPGRQASHPAPPVSGDLYLKGVITLSSSPPVALIQNSRTGAVHAYAEGELLDGGEIAKITRRYVLLVKEGALFKIGGAGVSPAEPEKAQQAVESLEQQLAAKDAASENDQQADAHETSPEAQRELLANLEVAKLGANLMGVESAALVSMVTNSDLLLQGADITWPADGSGPVFNDIADESILAKLGFRKGDRITAANGQAITGPHELLNGLASLMATGEVALQIETESGKKDFTYALTDFEPAREPQEFPKGGEEQ